MVRLGRESLLAGLRGLLLVTAVVAWAVAVVMAVGRLDDLGRLLDTVYRAEISMGSANIELSGVWIGIAVIVGTTVLVKVVKPLLEVEFLPRMTAKPGLPFAISAVTRYLLVTAGVLLAMAAMGIELTKVTLLAGALGVGIGFGLQGVVNNFVCGLILLLERPLNVGDVVQVGQLRGRVQRIGVRSSTVRTPQGAEVIVPNADLISKDVTNWTLSDRRRRLEIDVGVADTAEPDEVVRLLEEAAKNVSDVLTVPPPSASFMAFAEGWLNFRLQVWVDDYDRGGETESAVRVAILKKFRDAGIPLPPRDARAGSGAATP
jgi:small-conductance mechanosensitive channel